MTDDEFADLLNSAGVMEASTRNDLAHLEGYDTYNFNSFTQQPLEHMGGNPPDMWIHGLPSTAVGINTPAPFDPLGGLMMGDGSWAGNNNATASDIIHLGLANMEATLSGIQATLNQTDSSLQSVFARQSALEAMMIDLEDKLGKLKNSLNEYSSTTFDLLHDIHFATSHENGESPRICEDYGTSTDCDGTEKTSDEEYDPNFNLEDYFDEDSLYDRRSV